MTREEITALDIEQIEARSAELLTEIESADAEAMDAIQEELTAMEERKAQIAAEIEERKKDVAAVVSGMGEVLEKEERKEENTMEFRNTPEYINAYADYIKSGSSEELRTLFTENGYNGGTVPVPEMVYDTVKTAWEKDGIMSMVKKAYVKGNMKVSFEISSTTASMVGEDHAEINEENLVLGVVSLVPWSIKKWIGVSDELYDLRGEEFLRYIYSELTYRIAKKAADAVIAKIEACGTVSTTTCPGVPVLNADPYAGTIAAAMSLLSDEAANPVIIMNKITWGVFKANQYQANFDADPFEGLPVLFNNTIKPLDGSIHSGDTYAIVGDLGHGFLANYPAGENIEIKFDDRTLMTKDIVRILGRQFVALEVVAPNAFVKITKE